MAPAPAKVSPPSDVFPLAGRSAVRVRSLFLGERLDLTSFASGERLGTSPLVVQVGATGVAVLFRYGVVVCFGVDAVEEASLRRHLAEVITTPFSAPEIEEVSLAIDPAHDDRPEGGSLRLREISLERVQLIADVMAKTVVLAYYEQIIAAAFDKVEPMAVALQRKARARASDREMLQHIGGTLLVQTKMVGRVGVGDKPELLWERPDLEPLYSRLDDEFELTDRHRALERKLSVVNQTAETMLEVLRHKHSIRVEWYIVALIVFDIALSLLGKVF